MHTSVETDTPTVLSNRLLGRKALVTGSSKGIGRGIAIRLAQEGAESGHAHDGGVDDVTLKDCEALLEHGARAVGGDVADGQPVVAGEHHRLLVGAEVVDAHGGDVGLAVGAPGAWF